MIYGVKTKEEGKQGVATNIKAKSSRFPSFLA
jgi:hypothetical protein